MSFGSCVQNLKHVCLVVRINVETENCFEQQSLFGE